MDIKQSLHEIIDNLPNDQFSLGYWQKFCSYYQKDGISFLQNFLELPKQQQALLNTLKAINLERDIKKLLELIIDTAIELTNAERGFLLAEGLEVARHFDKKNIVDEYRISRQLAAWVKENKMPIISDDAKTDKRIASYTSVNDHRMESILCIPLAIENNVIGVIYLDNRLVRCNFKKQHIQLISLFAEQVAISIENVRLSSQKDRDASEMRSRIQSQEQKIQDMRNILKDTSSKRSITKIYTHSSKMKYVLDMVKKIKDQNVPVLIRGESGTGKEVIANIIHNTGARSQQEFVAENCAAISESLVDSELFGHEKGAFTGATNLKQGILEVANKGTLFLDEVADLPLPLQAKLLRALEEKSIRRVGGTETIELDIRIIAATNRNLEEMVARKQFREDLYHRLKGIEIPLPPLRERKEDIDLLVDHFLGEIATDSRTPKKTVDKSMIDLLMKYDWPGNIRQLRNEVKSLAILSNDTLDSQHLSDEIKKDLKLLSGFSFISNKVEHLPSLTQRIEKSEIIKALSVANNNISKASLLLGISRQTLCRKIERFGLDNKQKK